MVVRLSTVVCLALKLMWLKNAIVFFARKNLCQSSIKCHINSFHAKDWFTVNPRQKLLKNLIKKKQRKQEEEKQRQQHKSRRSQRRWQPGIELPEIQLSITVGKD